MLALDHKVCVLHRGDSSSMVRALPFHLELTTIYTYVHVFAGSKARDSSADS